MSKQVIVVGGGAAGCMAAYMAAKNGHKVTLFEKNEKIGKKIREGQIEKVPYMLVVGDRDMEDGTVSPRHRADGDLGAMDFADFAKILKDRCL